MSGYYDRQPGPHDFQSSEEGGAGGVDGRPNERGNTPRRRISSLSYQGKKCFRMCVCERVCVCAYVKACLPAHTRGHGIAMQKRRAACEIRVYWH
eukprot:1359864-Amorphochlora_amoeboformis.AAC.1